MSIDRENEEAWTEISTLTDLEDVKKLTRAFLSLAALVQETTGMPFNFERGAVEAVFVRYQDLVQYMKSAAAVSPATVKIVLCSAMLQRMHEVFGPNRGTTRAFRLAEDAAVTTEIHFSVYFCVEMFLAMTYRSAGHLHIPECNPTETLLVESIISFVERCGHVNKQMSYRSVFEHLNRELST